jgi:hypothetical protein
MTVVYKYVMQPTTAEYRTLISDAIANRTYSELDSAVAYATAGGVRSLEQVMPVAWRAWTKRWLIGIDWCRSEPAALSQLSLLANSRVRIFDGIRLVTRVGCVPDLPFHPKTYVLRGAHNTAVITGSGNLSHNGLERGHELGQLSVVDDQPGLPEGQLRSAHNSVSQWFDQLWRHASPLRPQLLREYSERYKERTVNPTPTDEDVTTPQQAQGRHRISSEDLVRLRVSSHLWIQAGRLHANRGAGNPGNQLMMSPMTRVFFGFPAFDVPPDTSIGTVEIAYGGQSVSRSLRFSNNSMDVLGLPIPGQEGPAKYDSETLLFTRSERDGHLYFGLRLGAGRDESAWRRASDLVHGRFAMTSGRQWGVF